MPRKSINHTKQFKLDSVHYVYDHPDLTQVECVQNLGISITTLGRWISQFKNDDSDIPTRGSGNYESDVQKNRSS